MLTQSVEKTGKLIVSGGQHLIRILSDTVANKIGQYRGNDDIRAGDGGQGAVEDSTFGAGYQFISPLIGGCKPLQRDKYR